MTTKVKVIGTVIFMVVVLASGYSYYKFADKKSDETAKTKPVQKENVDNSNETVNDSNPQPEEDSESSKSTYCADIATKYESFTGMFSETLVDKGDYYETIVTIAGRTGKGETMDVWGDRYATETVRISKDVVCHYTADFEQGSQNLTLEGYINEAGIDPNNMSIRMVGPQLFDGTGIVTDSRGYITEFWDFLGS